MLKSCIKATDNVNIPKFWKLIALCHSDKHVPKVEIKNCSNYAVNGWILTICFFLLFWKNIARVAICRNN